MPPLGGLVGSASSCSQTVRSGIPDACPFHDETISVTWLRANLQLYRLIVSLPCFHSPSHAATGSRRSRNEDVMPAKIMESREGGDILRPCDLEFPGPVEVCVRENHDVLLDFMPQLG